MATSMTGTFPAHLFISHSHKDEAGAYALANWCHLMWPRTWVFITHTGLAHRETIQKRSYLSEAHLAKAVLCLLTENSMTSDAVFDELKVALAAHVPIVLTFSPNPAEDDRRVYSYLQDMWRPKYGEAHDPSSPAGEQGLAAALQTALNETPPTPSPSITEMFERPRPAPGKSALAPPDFGTILANADGAANEALKFLAIIERDLENQAILRGAPAFADHNARELETDTRLAIVFAHAPEENWEPMSVGLRPLLGAAALTQLHLYARAAEASGVPASHLMKLFRFLGSLGLRA